MGLGLAEPGFATACYVEIEQYPRDVLIAGQRNEYMHAAPIWDDLKTFDATPWRGVVDTLLAGYPCQPFSQAGQRRGADDPRHLWPDIVRIIKQLGAGLRWCFFENVSGHLSLGYEAVEDNLRRLGFRVATGLFTAEETRSPHGRERLFIVAYRQGDDCRCKFEPHGQGCRRTGFAGDDGELGDASCKRRQQVAGSTHGHEVSNDWRCAKDGDQSTSAVTDVDHATSARRDDARQRSEANIKGRECVLGAGCGDMADTDSEQFCPDDQRSEPRADRRHDTAGRRGNSVSEAVVNTEGIGRRKGWAEHVIRSRGNTATDPSRPFLHAPGPKDMDAWRAALDLAPDLAPATALRDVIGVANRAAQMVAQGHMAQAEAERIVCRMVDALAARPRALRLLGNGVHPLAAAHAWRTLSAAHGLGIVDLGEAGSTETSATGVAVLNRHYERHLA